MKSPTPKNWKVLFGLIGSFFEQIKSEIEKDEISELEFQNVKSYINTQFAI